ncbi:MAG: hypothetical protein ACKOKB_10040, partial [Bacteroidota bacterium]
TSVIFVFLLMAGVSSCKKDDTSTLEGQIRSNIESGKWRISKFIDSGDDETSNFSGYNFDFGTSGSVTATNGVNSYTGTWSITDSNSDDDNLSDLDFNLNFNLTNNFQDLNDDWDFISQSETKIELIDVSGGNGGTDYLTFVKN